MNTLLALGYAKQLKRDRATNSIIQSLYCWLSSKEKQIAFIAQFGSHTLHLFVHSLPAFWFLASLIYLTQGHVTSLNQLNDVHLNDLLDIAKALAFVAWYLSLFSIFWKNAKTERHTRSPR